MILELIYLLPQDVVFIDRLPVFFADLIDQMGCLSLLEALDLSPLLERVGDISEEHLDVRVSRFVQFDVSTLIVATLRARSDRLLQAFVAKYFLALSQEVLGGDVALPRQTKVAVEPIHGR